MARCAHRIVRRFHAVTAGDGWPAESLSPSGSFQNADGVAYLRGETNKIIAARRAAVRITMMSWTSSLRHAIQKPGRALNDEELTANLLHTFVAAGHVYRGNVAQLALWLLAKIASQDRVRDRSHAGLCWVANATFAMNQGGPKAMSPPSIQEAMRLFPPARHFEGKRERM